MKRISTIDDIVKPSDFKELSPQKEAYAKDDNDITREKVETVNSSKDIKQKNYWEKINLRKV